MISIACDFDGVARDYPEVCDMPNRRARRAFIRVLRSPYNAARASLQAREDYYVNDSYNRATDRMYRNMAADGPHGYIS